MSTVSISTVHIFQIDNIMSKAQVNAVERYVDEEQLGSRDLLILQVNSKSFTNESVDLLSSILDRSDSYVGIWLGPNKFEVEVYMSNLLEKADFVGAAPGVVLYDFDNENLYNNVPTMKDFLLKISEDTNSELAGDSSDIRFVKPSLVERLYITLSNPFFIHIFLMLGFALISLELFALGPGIMAIIGSLLIILSSLTFSEFNINLLGVLFAIISSVLYLKILSRGYFSILGISAYLLLVLSGWFMFKNHVHSYGILSIAATSLSVALFYFIAIPTIIRSRLTTDSSAMSSLTRYRASYEGPIDDESSLFKINSLVIKINHSKGERFNENKFYKVVENDGRLEIQ